MRTKRLRPVKDNFDGPWKVYFQDNLRYFIQFVDKAAYDQIDWSREPEFLDKELRRISHGFKKSLAIADCLVKVWLKSGEERWILIHVEFQSQKDPSLPERMLIYNIRSFDHYRVPVASFAVLADDNLDWKPNSYSYGFGQSETSIRYGVLKLTDYIGRENELEQSDNPFALAILAHLKTIETKGNPEARYGFKLRLAKMLFKRGWERRAVDSQFYFIDWVMKLPKELEDKFDREIVEDGEGTIMELMSPRQRKWTQIGRVEGKVEGKVEASQLLILDTLIIRFGSTANKLEARIRLVDDFDALLELHRKAHNSATLSDFERSLPHGTIQ